MSAKIIDGKAIAADIRQGLRGRVQGLFDNIESFRAWRWCWWETIRPRQFMSRTR